MIHAARSFAIGAAAGLVIFAVGFYLLLLYGDGDKLVHQSPC